MQRVSTVVNLGLGGLDGLDGRIGGRDTFQTITGTSLGEALIPLLNYEA